MIDNYNELSVGKYLRVLELCEDKSLDNVERQVAILSVLSGKTEDEILNLPLLEYMEMSGRLKFLEKSPDLPESPAKSYKVGKWVLVPVADIRNMTAAQYIDFQTFAAQDGSRTVEIISCMVVPEGMKYNDGYDIVELQNDIREMMPVTDAMSLYAFFLNSSRQSISNILTFSAVATTGTKRPLKERIRTVRALMKAAILSRRNGTGLRVSTLFQRHAGALGRKSGK